MALIDRIVDIKITRNTKGLTKSEFSTILIIGDSLNEDDVNQYFSLAEVAEKYAITTNEYKVAALIFGQVQTVTKILIGQTKASETVTAAYNRIGAIFNFYAVVPIWPVGSTLDNMVELAAAIEASQGANATPRVLGLVEIDQDDLTLMSAIKTANYNRTFVIFNVPTPAQTAVFPNAAWFGALLPPEPGTQTWAYKNLVGINADLPTDGTLTNAKMVAIEAQNGNYYTNFGGRDVTINGKMGSGEFIDIIYGIDWLENAMQQDSFCYQPTYSIYKPRYWLSAHCNERLFRFGFK
jgi:hypothetical protein